MRQTLVPSIPVAQLARRRQKEQLAVRSRRCRQKLKMVEKDGKKVPAFAADGVGKMKRGGATKDARRHGR
jgi:hypothetical protein